MHAQQLIDDYVREVTWQLPAGHRADVASELRALLAEDLQARAAAAGTASNEVMARELLLGFGRPADVAARYYTAAHIIAPVDSRRYLISALLGLIPLALFFELAGWRLRDTAVLSWWGLLALGFAVKQHWQPDWIAELQRRASGTAPERVNRIALGCALVLYVGAMLVLLDPTALLPDYSSAQSQLPQWLAYSEPFRRLCVPVLLTVMLAQAGLRTWLLVRGSWQPLMRRIDSALQWSMALALLWCALAGPVFATGPLNSVVRVLFAVLAVSVGVGAVLRLQRTRQCTVSAGTSSVAALIDSYVVAVTRRLAKQRRDDVALELKGLIYAELQPEADAPAVLQRLRKIGPPPQVAARYQSFWTLIEPADTRSFVRAAVLGVAVLALLVAMPAVASGQRLPISAVLWWVGLMVIVFACKAWLRRRQPFKGWGQRDLRALPSDRASRTGSAVVSLVTLFWVAALAYPAAVLDFVLTGLLERRFASDALVYTPEVVSAKGPALLVLLTLAATIYAAVAGQGRWTTLTRRAALVCNVLITAVLLWLALSGDIFVAGPFNQPTKGFLALFAICMLVEVAFMLYRGHARERNLDALSGSR